MKRREFIGAALALTAGSAAGGSAEAFKHVAISADPADSRYTPLAAKCAVYLDGNRLENCITADERSGQALAIIPDHSLSVLYMERMPEPKWMTGEVRIQGLSYADRKSLRGSVD